MHIILIASFMFFALARSLKALQFFQQEGYSNGDFAKFIFHRFQLIDKRLSLLVFIYTIFAAGHKNYMVDAAVLSAFFIGAGLRHKNPLKDSRPKKKFALTARAERILCLAAFADFIGAVAMFGYLSALTGTEHYCLCRITGYLILFIQTLPFTLIAANLALFPLEYLIRRRYLGEARSRIEKLKPIVIGITGSFGKTSTKNILNHILGAERSLATARSINTLMGIARVVREKLEPRHKYFIAEIGTGTPGKVAEICRLVQPRHAILTAIGNMHYAYFKSRAAVAREKFGIFKSVVEAGGAAVVNRLQVEDGYTREFLGGYTGAAFLSGRESAGPEYRISGAKVGIDGVSFKLSHDGKTWAVAAPVYGIHQTKDIALAFIMALKLGLKPEAISASLKTLPQTRHRQEVIYRDDGTILVDDAYNSNIDGFESALETARTIAGKRRVILVSPGMLELGKLHDEYHARAAKKALATADVAIMVVPGRIRAFTEAFKKGMRKGQQLVLASNFKEADEWIRINRKKGDVYLYENDLADLYVEEIRI